MRISTLRKLAASSHEVEWIVDNLISPGGWTYLVGPAGSGKSMLCIQLVDALQEGKLFLGRKTKKHNCLYIQADSGTIEWQVQVSNLASESTAWTIYEIERDFLDREAEVKRLHSIVWGEYDESPPYYPALKKKRFDFIVFDCLTAITAQELSTKASMSKVLNALMDITTKVTKIEGAEDLVERAHFLLVHHPNTGPTRGTNAGSGYKGFGNLSGNFLTFANNLLVLEKSKITSKQELALERGEKGRWILPEDEIPDVYDEDYLSNALT